jgi:hypothetical protein
MGRGEGIIFMSYLTYKNNTLHKCCPFRLGASQCHPCILRIFPKKHGTDHYM